MSDNDRNIYEAYDKLILAHEENYDTLMKLTKSMAEEYKKLWELHYGRKYD
jgi:hypothetical protein